MKLDEALHIEIVRRSRRNGCPADSVPTSGRWRAVLYEMITGRVLFDGRQEQAVFHAIVHQEHEPVTALRVGLPTELDGSWESRGDPEGKKPLPAVSGRRLGWKVVPLRGYQMNRALYWNSRPECVGS